MSLVCFPVRSHRVYLLQLPSDYHLGILKKVRIFMSETIDWQQNRCSVISAVVSRNLEVGRGAGNIEEGEGSFHCAIV